MTSTSSHSSSHRRKGSRLYATHDQWHVTSAVSSGGVVQERYAYDAFGGSIVLTRAFARRTNSIFDWETRFGAYRFDDESQLYCVRFRYLNAAMGRWLSRDPIEDVDGNQAYWYCNNNGINNSDLLGLIPNAFGGYSECHVSSEYNFSGVSITNIQITGIYQYGMADALSHVIDDIGLRMIYVGICFTATGTVKVKCIKRCKCYTPSGAVLTSEATLLEFDLSFSGFRECFEYPLGLTPSTALKALKYLKKSGGAANLIGEYLKGKQNADKVCAFFSGGK